MGVTLKPCTAIKTARIDMRISPTTRAQIEAMAVKTRRTLASIIDEALEDIIAKHSK